MAGETILESLLKGAGRIPFYGSKIPNIPGLNFPELRKLRTVLATTQRTMQRVQEIAEGATNIARILAQMTRSHQHVPENKNDLTKMAFSLVNQSHGFSMPTRYFVKIDPPNSQEFDKSVISRIGMNCAETSYGQETIETHDTRLAGPRKKTAHQRNNDGISMTFYLGADRMELAFFRAWMNTAISGENFSAGYYDEYAKHCSITVFKYLLSERFGEVLDTLPVINVATKFLEIFPVAISPIQVGHGVNGIERITVQFVYNRIESLEAYLKNSDDDHFDPLADESKIFPTDPRVPGQSRLPLEYIADGQLTRDPADVTQINVAHGINIPNFAQIISDPSVLLRQTDLEQINIGPLSNLL